MQAVIDRMSPKKDAFLTLIDEDSEAFNLVMQAMKLPKQTEDEKQERTRLLQASLIKAADAPYKIAEAASLLFDDIEILVKHGNAHAQTDALVAAMLARTAILAALYNVKINLLSIKDTAYTEAMQLKVQRLEALAHHREEEILNQSDL
jgi:formiminotetrahydrofolate cyclodeaminase